MYFAEVSVCMGSLGISGWLFSLGSSANAVNLLLKHCNGDN